MTLIKKLSGIVPLAVVAACSSLTTVDAPHVVLPDNLASPSGAKILMNGAIAKLSLMYGEWGFYFAMTDEALLGFSDPTDQRGYSYILTNDYNTWIGGYVSYFGQPARIAALQAIPAMQKYTS